MNESFVELHQGMYFVLYLNFYSLSQSLDIKCFYYRVAMMLENAIVQLEDSKIKMDLIEV